MGWMLELLDWRWRGLDREPSAGKLKRAGKRGARERKRAERLRARMQRTAARRGRKR